jgi:hypothetical protein
MRAVRCLCHGLETVWFTEFPTDRHVGLQVFSGISEATTPSIMNMMCLGAGNDDPYKILAPFGTFSISKGKSRATLSGINLH